MKRWAPALLSICFVLPSGASAQVPTGQTPAAPPRAAPTARLTLAEALEQGRRHSPAYRQVLNDAGPANWGVRNAYANLLPSFDVSGGMGYTGSGSSTFGGATFQVGANVGDSAAAIRSVGPVPVLCIEGDPDYLDYLRRNARTMGPGVAVEECFIGAERGAVDPLAFERHDGTTSAVGALREGAGQGVPVRRLEEILEHHQPFDGSELIKVDTDGYDFDTLSAHAAYLERTRPVLFFEYLVRTEEDARRAEFESARLAAEHAFHQESTCWRQEQEQAALKRAEQEKLRIEAEARERAAEETRRRIAEEELKRIEEELRRMHAMEQIRRADVEEAAGETTLFGGKPFRPCLHPGGVGGERVLRA